MKPGQLPVLALAAWLFLFSPGCGRRAPEESGAGPEREEISMFEYRRVGPELSLVMTGEAATREPGGDARVSRPAGRLETDQGRVIYMETAPEGEAELSFAPGGGEIEVIRLSGGVRVTVRDRETDAVELRAESERMTYTYARGEFVLTGSPVVFYGDNEFRGGVIRYLVREGRIVIEGGASGLIRQEETR